MPLANRLQKEASTLIGIGLASIDISHSQNPREDISVTRVWMVVHRQCSARHSVINRSNDLGVLLRQAYRLSARRPCGGQQLCHRNVLLLLCLQRRQEQREQPDQREHSHCFFLLERFVQSCTCDGTPPA